MNTPSTLPNVLQALQEEFTYSQRWDAKRRETGAPEHQMDCNKPVEAWLLWMEEYLAKARTAATQSTDKTAALHEVRKVANLAIACLTYQGCPVRDSKVPKA